jgi:hypothetical protein
LPVDDAQHGGAQVDGEDVVGVGEEADAGDDDGAGMTPAKGSGVDLGEGTSATLVGVFDMGKGGVVVGEGGVSSGE